MSITKHALQNLATRLIISPPPSTLGESTAVLKKLQSFGHVVSFTASPLREMREIHPPPDNEQLDMTVVFSSQKTIEMVEAASPFTVRVNHNLPDPRVEDPYNVRNLQTRQQPLPKTMVCHLELHGADLPSGQNILSDGFSPSDRTRLHQSLTNLEPPPGIAAALSVFHTQTSDIRTTPDMVLPVSNLTSMYRSDAKIKSKKLSPRPFIKPVAKFSYQVHLSLKESGGQR